MKKRNSNRLNLYSKFKLWCALHRVPFYTIPIVLVGIVFIGIFLIGGSLAGWEIAKFLSSPSGTLAIVLIIVAILAGLAYVLVFKKR